MHPTLSNSPAISRPNKRFLNRTLMRWYPCGASLCKAWPGRQIARVLEFWTLLHAALEVPRSIALVLLWTSRWHQPGFVQHAPCTSLQPVPVATSIAARIVLSKCCDNYVPRYTFVYSACVRPFVATALFQLTQRLLCSTFLG